MAITPEGTAPEPADEDSMSVWTVVASVVVIVIGVLGAMAGLNKVLFGGAGWLAGLLASDAVQDIGGGIAINGVVRILVGIAQVVGGAGMLMMRRWGWWTAVVATGILLANRALGLITDGVSAWDLLGVLGLVIPGLVMGVLLLRRVRREYT